MSSTEVISIKGATEIQRALRPLLEPELDKQLDLATKAAAQTYGKALKPELRRVSRRMARAVRVRRAKRDRPAWVVGSNRRIAFFWAWVIGGTKDHGPRRAKALVWDGPNGVIVARRVRGVKANPIVERVAARFEGRAFHDAEQQFDKGTGL